MQQVFSNERRFVFVPSPLATPQLKAIIDGLESELPVHPIDPSYPTSVAVRRVFDADEAGVPGYVITYGAQDPVMQPIHVDVVQGADDNAKIEAARQMIGRGGEFMGFADFGPPGALESVVIYRRAAQPPPPPGAVGSLGGIFTAPGHDWLTRLDQLNPTTVNNMPFQGLAPGGLRVLQNQAIFMVTDADIDTDGPGGSKAKDPSWQIGTSLEQRSGVGCDSRIFPGVVLPPAIRSRFGAEIGGFAVVFFENRMAACQVYDSGPTDKVGEISVGLAWSLGIPPVPPSGASQAVRDEIESRAARKGNNVRNLVTVVFPGPGARPAASLATIAQQCAARLQALTGAPNPPVFSPIP